ncbi:hypothetical protein C8F01DRAFT_1085727 [Mycena amicta]|nr:hypothetical protein C8F01DRAFT_1085727 [Mycena amicta]
MASEPMDLVDSDLNVNAAAPDDSSYDNEQPWQGISTLVTPPRALYRMHIRLGQLGTGETSAIVVHDDSPPLTHFTSLLRLECSDTQRVRFAGIADVIAERFLAIHETAAQREDRRHRRSGKPYTVSEWREAPTAAGTFPVSRLPGSPLAAAVLDEVLVYIRGQSKLMAYAVRAAPRDLYLGPVRETPDLTEILHRIPKQYICGICLSPKSHPAILKSCLHSFCYVGIRIAVNDSFACPVCCSIQHEPPLPAVEEDEAIQYEILPDLNWTVVLHSWEGVRFPHEPYLGAEMRSDEDKVGISEQAVSASVLNGGTLNPRLIATLIVRVRESSGISGDLKATLKQPNQADLGVGSSHDTEEARQAAHHGTQLKYDHSEHGRTVRGERVRSHRRISKNHISRIRLPDLVEDWAAADLRRDYNIFNDALQPDFDESEAAHWLQPPPFDMAAIA